MVKTAYDVATLPVRAVSKGVDLMTTSQSEADEKRGRALRKRDERIGKLERGRAKAAAACDRGDARACTEAESLQQVIEAEKARPI